MPAILRDLPFFGYPTTVEVGGERRRVYALQQVVWVSVGFQALRELDPRAPRFPAVYDSGFTGAFLINREHLRRWAGLHPDYLSATNEVMRPHGRRVPLRAANVWLHPNRRGERDEFSGAAPFLLEIDSGIGVWGDPDDYPRLPLLGPLAFLLSGLEVCVDHRKLRINARAPRRFWFF